MPPALALLRPKQWTKNLLVFAAIIFTARFGEQDSVIKTLAAFFAICLVSSAVYAVNDALDAEKDKSHHKKKNRPVAAGKISQTNAFIIAVIVLAVGLGIGAWVGQMLLSGLTVYLILQVIYNVFTKNQPILDVFTIAAGFVLRAGLGAAAIDATISGWLLFCTGSLALLLGFGKRRSELLSNGTESRPALEGYTEKTLDGLVIVSSALAGISYGIYALQSPTASVHPGLIFTAPIVLFGIARYLLLSMGDRGAEEPENIVLKDGPMIVTLILFAAVAVYAMSAGPVPLLAAPVQQPLP